MPIGWAAVFSQGTRFWLGAPCFECAGPYERRATKSKCIQGFLAHKKTPPLLGTPYESRHRPTVGS